MLEELKAALAAATPGRLYADGERFCESTGNIFKHGAVLGVCAGGKAKANAHLIALMHNALPALIECAEALKDCHARLELLTESGRGKMLDAVAEQRAEAALAKLKE